MVSLSLSFSCVMLRVFCYGVPWCCAHTSSIKCSINSRACRILGASWIYPPREKGLRREEIKRFDGGSEKGQKENGRSEKRIKRDRDRERKRKSEWLWGHYIVHISASFHSSHLSHRVGGLGLRAQSKFDTRIITLPTYATQWCIYVEYLEGLIRIMQYTIVDFQIFYKLLY